MRPIEIASRSVGTGLGVGIDTLSWNSRAAERVNIQQACSSPTMTVAIENGMLALTCAGRSPGLSHRDPVEKSKGSRQLPYRQPHNIERMPPI